MEICLLTFVATNAIINPRQAAILIAMRSPETSASQPITGGPTRKPKKLMLDTMVMAILALTVPNWQTPVPVQNNKLPQPLACEPSRSNHSFEMSSYISFNMKLKNAAAKLRKNKLSSIDYSQKDNALSKNKCNFALRTTRKSNASIKPCQYRTNKTKRYEETNPCSSPAAPRPHPANTGSQETENQHPTATHLPAPLAGQTSGLLRRLHHRPQHQGVKGEILGIPAAVARHHTLRLRGERTTVERHSPPSRQTQG